MISVPQKVRWGPVDGKGPGIVVEDATQSFISWEELKPEIERLLLPQVRVVPIGSQVVVGPLGDRENWIVQVLQAGSNQELGHVWFGSNPEQKWRWDGLIRIGQPSSSSGESVVWQVFQRYSDGTYRRLRAERTV